MEESAQFDEPAEAEIQKLVWPTILELQRLLVDRTRATTTTRGGEAVGVVSVTSCTHHSCH